MPIVIQLPEVKREKNERPIECPHCKGETFQRWGRVKKQIKDPDSIFMPFVLKAVDRSGLYCSLCHWQKKCNGCIIDPNDAPLFEDHLLSKIFIAIEWNSKILEEQYNQVANEVVEHVSTKEKTGEIQDTSNYTTLDDCIMKFHKTEQLENEMTCAKCKT